MFTGKAVYSQREVTTGLKFGVVFLEFASL